MDESGESTQKDDVTGVGRGESQTDRLHRWRWRRKAGRFRRQGEAYQRERSVARI